MFREIINTVSFSLLMILLMAMFISIAYLSAYFSEFFVPHKKENTPHQLANSFMSILTGGFFVLLAFIIINTWNYQQEARTAAAKEADYLAIIMRNIAVFPPEPQKKIREAVANYAVIVRTKEWVSMRLGEENPLAWEALDYLYATIQHFQPTSTREQLFYTLVIGNMNGVLLSRRERLNKIETLIPKNLTYSIFIGSIFLAFLLGIIRGRDTFMNLAPVLLFSGVFGFNLAVAISFDYPYSGEIAVSNKSFYSGVLGTFPDIISPRP